MKFFKKEQPYDHDADREWVIGWLREETNNNYKKTLDAAEIYRKADSEYSKIKFTDSKNADKELQFAEV